LVPLPPFLVVSAADFAAASPKFFDDVLAFLEAVVFAAGFLAAGLPALFLLQF